MTFARAVIKEGGLGGQADPGQVLLSQLIPTTNATAGNATLSAAQVASGWLQRSGPAGGFTDTWPTADGLVALFPDVAVGDCFQFIYQNTVAQVMTFAAGTGIVSGTGTLGAAASVTRIYYHTFLSTKPQVILVGNNDGVGAILTGFTALQLASVMPGMGVTGTGIAASSVVLGVTPGDGSNDSVTGGKITLNNNTTSANANIPFTIFPRIRLDSIGVLAA